MLHPIANDTTVMRLMELTAYILKGAMIMCVS